MMEPCGDCVEWTQKYQQLCHFRDELKAERDRYKEALEEIAADLRPLDGRTPTEIAEQALGLTDKT